MRSRLAQAPPWSIALACVALAYSVAQLALTLDLGLGSDEALYISQFARGVPAEPFEAPRAWGLPLLVAPVAAFTASVTAIRVYLSVLSGAGLFLAYWPWLRLFKSGAVPLAAFLFACMWPATYYGNQAMPNLYVAFGAVAAVGLFSLSLSGGRSRAALVGLGASFAFLSLVRPSDALWIAAPLVLATLAVPRWRGIAPVLAIAAGLAVGWGEWVVEAYLRFGGPLDRLHQAGTENSVGLHFSLGKHLRVLDGPVPCFPGGDCGPYPLSGTIWFLALPLLAGAGLLAARGSPRFLPLVLATVAAIAVGASYVLLVGYAAPRFLLPYYALLLIPATGGLWWLARHAPAPRPIVVALTAAAVAAFLAVQFHTLDRALSSKQEARGDYQAVAAAIRERADIRPPCFILGDSAVQVAYAGRCTAALGGSKLGGAAPPVLASARAAGKRVAVVVQRKAALPRSSFLRRWTRIRLRAVGATPPWDAYVPRPRATRAN